MTFWRSNTPSLFTKHHQKHIIWKQKHLSLQQCKNESNPSNVFQAIARQSWITLLLIHTVQRYTHYTHCQISVTQRSQRSRPSQRSQRSQHSSRCWRSQRSLRSQLALSSPRSRRLARIPKIVGIAEVI